MRVHTPPRLALALLSRWLGGDPLIGDLVEEFDAGRGRAWFWRQALMAVAVRGPRVLRVGAVAALVLIVAPVLGYVGYARSVSAAVDLPMLVERMTIEQMMRSVRTDDVYAPLRIEGRVVDVTGVLRRVIPAEYTTRPGVPALYVTSAFDVPEFGAVFLLDPAFSIDVDVLMPGEPVTLRCPVLDQRVSPSFCVVFQ